MILRRLPPRIEPKTVRELPAAIDLELEIADPTKRTYRTDKDEPNDEKSLTDIVEAPCRDPVKDMPLPSRLKDCTDKDDPIVQASMAETKP